MKKDLNFTTNNLKDIIEWLRNGYMVCIYSYNKKKFYFSKENLNEINDENIIYVDLMKMSSLLNPGEWPWYIQNEGFFEYKSTNVLPNNENNIYNLQISF